MMNVLQPDVDLRHVLYHSINVPAEVEEEVQSVHQVGLALRAMDHLTIMMMNPTSKQHLQKSGADVWQKTEDRFQK
jgi:hypothetical protein